MRDFLTSDETRAWRFLTSLKNIRVCLTYVKGLAPSLLCNRLMKMGDVHSLNIGNRDKLDTPSFRFTAGQQPWEVRLWNDYPESSVNIANLNQPKAEVRKHYFLISFFFTINFTYCKVDNYAFNYQIAIVKLTEKSFYGVGW